MAQVRVEPLKDIPPDAKAPSLSPDGKTLAYEWCDPDYSCALYTREFHGQDVRLFAEKDDEDGFPGEPRWSPDGKWIAFTRFYSRWDVRLFVRGFRDGPELEFGQIFADLAANAWTPDSRFLVVGTYIDEPGGDCQPSLFSLDGISRTTALAPRGSIAGFSPDGRLLAYADERNLMPLRLTLDYQPVAPAQLLAREPREISSLVWTPHGKRIVYQGWGDVPYWRQIAVGPAGKPQPVPGLPDAIDLTQILPDGMALATETASDGALHRRFCVQSRGRAKSPSTR